MDWQQLELDLAAAQLARAEALLSILGAASITLAPCGGDEILEPEPGTTPVWTATTVRALFPASIDVERVAAWLSESLGDRVAIRVALLPETAWAGALASEPRKLSIGSRLLICGAQHAPEAPGRLVVRLHRGPGFGTGDHPTTRLCLEWLDASFEAGSSIVDYGCGSGILGVSALRLGASKAWAVDVEPQALQAAAANAALNGVGERLWTGRPDELRARAADAVLANILAKPLIELAPRFASLVSPRGSIVLSGLLRDQFEAVRDAYSPYFATFTRRDRDGWTCLTASARRL